MDDVKTSFLEAIKTNPRDWDTRKVFADWLEEQDEIQEADEQRRWNDEIQNAWEWLENLAKEGGRTCVNYSEHCASYNRDKGICTVDQIWKDITIQDLIQAGHDYIDSKGREWWVQQGAEELRDLMYQPGVKECYWKNWSLVTNRPLPKLDLGAEDPDWEHEYEFDGLGNPFSCTC